MTEKSTATSPSAEEWKASLAWWRENTPDCPWCVEYITGSPCCAACGRMVEALARFRAQARAEGERAGRKAERAEAKEERIIETLKRLRPCNGTDHPAGSEYDYHVCWRDSFQDRILARLRAAAFAGREK